MKVSEGRKPDGYWLNSDNMKMELQPLIDKFGYIPNTGFYFRNGYKCLGRAIGRYGIKKLSDDLGIPIKQTRLYSVNDERPPDYWKDWNNFKREILPLIEENGNLPSTWTLKQKKLYSISNAISKYHGGIQAVREKLGLPKWPNAKIKEKEFNKYDNFEVLIEELKPIITEYKTIPPYHVVGKKLSRQAHLSIGKTHGGYVKLRSKLGLPKWKQTSQGDTTLYRRLAKKNYGDFCAICGYSNITNVHHIDEDKTNNNLENLIVLCPNHHAEVHKGMVKNIKIYQKLLEVTNEL